MKLLTLDAETSGVDVVNDRIITFFMRAKDGSEVVLERNWVIDPGIEIPTEASDIHGMTTEWVREHGRKGCRGRRVVGTRFRRRFGMDEYEDPILGYMSLGSSQEEPADYVLWNMSGPEVYDELGKLLRTGPDYRYQILVKEVRIENSNL